MNKFIITSAVLFLAAATAHADPSVQASAPAPAVEKQWSVNLNPLGILMGSYGGNVEWLHGSHGLIAGASYFHVGNESISVGAFEAKVGYRWHWRGRQNSGFLGVNASFDAGSASATVTSDTGAMETSDLTVRTFAVTANIGKRWQLDSGVNITLAFGAGRAYRTVSTSSSDPDLQQAAHDTEELLALFPIAIDGELSLGYSF